MFVEELKNTKEWENFLKVTPGATFYHSIKWKNVIEKSFSHPTIYLVVKDENGRLVGVCPTAILTSGHLRMLDSLPHSDLGGPVIEKKYIEEASLSLLRFIEELSPEKGISCAKMCFLKDGSERFFKSSRCYVNNNKGVVDLDLRANPSAFIWSKIFRKRHRRKIKHFERDGFQVREATTKSDLKTFLTLYYSNMRHIGAPPRPYTFFENVWSLLYPENFNILLAEKKKTVGGLGFFKYGETIYLTYVGMDRESLSARYSISPYLDWNAIKWAEENGFRYVCFGSTPAHPKSARERANYSRKVMFGGSFSQQETVFIPFDLYAFTTLLLGSKAINSWKAMREILPTRLQQTIESRLRGIF